MHMLRLLYLHANQLFWLVVIIALVSAIFSISINTFFQGTKIQSKCHQKQKAMKSIFRIIVVIAACTASFTACKKEDTAPPATQPTADTGRVYLEFFNEVGGSTLTLNNQWYKNPNGDSFKVSKFNYYISNIVLKGAGTTPDYTEAESYHLIEHTATPSEMAFYLDKVPAGTYASVSFMIGVDSLRNVSGAQTGDLDPAKGNFWSWNTGYIMLKLEGESPKSPSARGMLMLHCGGFSGASSVVKTLTLSLPDAIDVTKGQPNHIHLRADIQKMFQSPNVIDFATTHTIHMPGASARKLADNYANMFTITYSGL